MATMIDEMSKKFKGEQFVWKEFKELLPDDIIIYNTREVRGKEFDFCLLIQNKGILIVEVKGWNSEGIKVETPDKIILSNGDSSKSPKKQARMYKFCMINTLQKELGFTPLVMDMVCYPFINEKEYYSTGLKIVSEIENTIVSEDFESSEKLMTKIDQAYDLAKGVPHTYMSEEKLFSIRQMFEPLLKADHSKADTISPYSIVSFSPTKLSSNSIDHLINQYSQGVKQIVFVKEKEDYKLLIEKLNMLQKNKDISINASKVSLGYKEEAYIKDNDDSVSIFNFQIYFYDHLDDICSSFNEINEGEMTSSQYDYLNQLSKVCSFNFDQYKVEHSDPNSNVLVEAGAGTGKTYCMVSRVAYLCNKSNNPMKNLTKDLAMITFTNAAADNMKSRLKQMFINYFILTNNNKYLRYIDDINKAHISTIHKFVIEVLRTNPVYTGLGAKFNISTNKYLREQIYDRNLSDLINNTGDDKFRELPVNIYELRKKIIGFSDALSQKSVDISELEESQLGYPQNDVISEMNSILQEVMVPSEAEYSRALSTENKLPLSSIIIMLNHVLKTYDEELFSLGYRYIFIDEFQDTDDVQIDLFKRIQDRIGNKCTFFIVGDLKQSIYRFRGATMSAFDRMKNDSLNNWNNYSLNINYRTNKKLLQDLDDVFCKLNDENYLKYDQKDRLTSNILDKIPDTGLSVIQTTGKDNKIFFDDLALVIKEQINILKNHKDITSKKGNNYNTIAILTRTNSEVSKIKKELANRNIDVEVESTGNLYQLQSTLDLYRLLQALVFSKDNIRLIGLMESNYIRTNMDYQIFYSLSQEEIQEKLYEYLNDYFIKTMGESFDEVINDVYTKPALYVLKHVYDKLQPWKQYGIDEEKQKEYMDNYSYLLERIIKNFDVDRLTINQILEYLRINIVTGQEHPSRENSNHKKQIKIIASTVHKSKGLEYGTVILPYADKDLSKMPKNGIIANFVDDELSYWIGFRDHLYEHNEYFNENSEIDDQIDDEARVLYVALTRAIRNCIWFKNSDSKVEICWETMLGE